jgi:hypothetical protein
MEQWEIDLNNQLADKIQPIIIVKQTKKSVSGFLIFIVFALLVFLAGLYGYKKVSGFRLWVESHFKVEKNKNHYEGKEVDKSSLERIDVIEEQLKKNSRKLNLLGISHNENFSILNKQNPNKKFILLNHDWSLDRMPENIEIPSEDKIFIDNNIKP